MPQSSQKSAAASPLWLLVRYMAVVGGFVTFVGWVVGGFYPPKEAIQVTLLIVSAVVAVGLVGTLWHDRAILTPRRYTLLIASMALSVLVTGAVGYRLSTTTYRHNFTGSDALAGTTRPHFRPHSALLKGCEDIHGDGPIPRGYALLIFAQGVDGTGKPIGEHYLQTAATPEQDGWVVSNLQAGAPNTQIKLEAVLLDGQTADSFLSIAVYPNDNPRVNLSNVSLRMGKLPAAAVDSIMLTRDAGKLGCS